MHVPKAYQMEVRPIVLKALLVDCGINQRDIGRQTGLARTTINAVVNRGYLPVQHLNFKSVVEDMIAHNPAAVYWLTERGLSVKNIWEPIQENAQFISNQSSGFRWKHPAGHGLKIIAGQNRQALIPGDPGKITITWEVEMVDQEAMRHFKLFRNPFIDDIQKDSDIYMSDEHRYIEAAMVDAARHGGFLAVIGEVGSGKSVMRRKVVEQLKKDGDVLVIFPQIIDKGRVNAGSICEAIIMDISDQKPKVKLEQKTRQVQKLLLERSKQGYRSCLIIEEAHDLSTQTLKYLKRFYELEDGYKKLLGIVLIGQTELKYVFNEAQHVEMREVIRRIQIAEIRGLNGNIKDYLTLKMKRVGVDVNSIFDENAFAALSKRLTSTDRLNKTISHAYPLLVNNYAAKAMNLAYKMGEEKVTEGVVMEI